MGAFKRLGMAYLGVGFVIAIIENWMAHVRAGSSILEIAFSAVSIGEKAQSAFDLVVVPIVAWPIHVLAMIRGG